MGLLTFIKETGEKLEEHSKAEALRSYINRLGLDMEGVDISVDGSAVSLDGTIATQEQREKLMLALGNIRGIEKVQDSLEVLEQSDESQTYTVQRGDTLGAIAKAHYGNASKYTVIFEANTPMLKNPDRIYPGQVLRIPKM